MPTFIHGKSTKVYIGGYDATDTLNQSGYNGAVEPADVTCFGASDKAFISGLITTETSAGGVYSGGTAEAETWLGSLFAGTPEAWVMWKDGDTFGNRGWAHPAIVSSYDIADDLGDAVKFTVAGQGSDAKVDHVVSLRALAAATGTAAGTNHDGGAAASNGGWAAYLNVVSGTVSAGTVIVEHSVDGATSWATLATFTFAGTAAIGGIGGAYSQGSGTVRRYVRHNLTGLAGTVRFAVAFARR